MRRKDLCLFGTLALAISLPACGDSGNPGVIPASKDAQSTRQAIENPSGAKETKKVALPKGVGSLPPQPPK